VSSGPAGQLVALYRQFRHLIHELGAFGVAGAFTAVLDIGLFNVFEHSGVEPILSKAMSTTVAAIVSYFINRHWAFRHRARSGARRELTLFIVLSAVGLGIVEACLGTSHYLLGLHSALADNVSANGIGLVLGTLFRYLTFKRWVFLPSEDADAAGRDAAINAAV
jgi:putative flippase GtrA